MGRDGAGISDLDSLSHLTCLPVLTAAIITPDMTLGHILYKAYVFTVPKPQYFIKWE